jgi:hypothetical protein
VAEHGGAVAGLLDAIGAPVGLRVVGHAAVSLGSGRILLFLKKKKQKDFIRLRRNHPVSPPQANGSFLVLFFKKEHLSSYVPVKFGLRFSL